MAVPPTSIPRYASRFSGLGGEESEKLFTKELNKESGLQARQGFRIHGCLAYWTCMVTNKPESKDVVLMMTVNRDRLGKKISECLNRYDEQNLCF